MTIATTDSKPAHAAKLKNVKISGFRSIKNLDLELGDLTVLVGANGSGKSNLLSFFEMMRHIVSRSLQDYVRREGGASSVLHYGPQHTQQIKAELDLDEGAQSSRYQLTLAFAKPDSLYFSQESWQMKHPIGGNFGGDLGSGHSELMLLNQLRDHPMGSHAGNSPTGHVPQVVENVTRDFRVYHFNETSETAAIRLSQDLHQNQRLTINAGNLAAFLYMLRHTRMQHFNRIVSTIQFAVPYFNNFILAPDPLSQNQRILLRWQDKRLDYDFGPHQLSDGSLRAIALITLLLQPKDLLPSIILLDEPELGLHPSAVGLIGSLIKAVSIDKQVIVATQSPRLLAEFAPEDVVVVEREEDPAGTGESTFKRLAATDLGSWLEEYDLGTWYEMNVTGGGPL